MAACKASTKLTLRFWYWYFLKTLFTVSRSSFIALAISLLDQEKRILKSVTFERSLYIYILKNYYIVNYHLNTVKPKYLTGWLGWRGWGGGGVVLACTVIPISLALPIKNTVQLTSTF